MRDVDKLVVAGVRKRWGRDPCGYGNILFLDCINVDRLGVMLNGRSAKYYDWRKRVHSTRDILVISYNARSIMLPKQNV